MNEDKAMKTALLTAALLAIAGCTSTPPPADPGQGAEADIKADGCGRQPVRTQMSSMSPRLVIYRACKAQARTDGKASEETKE
jgi:hypothetical protein